MSSVSDPPLFSPLFSCLRRHTTGLRRKVKGHELLRTVKAAHTTATMTAVPPYISQQNNNIHSNFCDACMRLFPPLPTLYPVINASAVVSLRASSFYRSGFAYSASPPPPSHPTKPCHACLPSPSTIHTNPKAVLSVVEVVCFGKMSMFRCSYVIQAHEGSY